MTPNPFTKQYLMTAGPTPIPPAVSQAMAAPMLYHRAPAFDEVYERVLSALPAVFRTSNDVLAFAASGSGALESAVANLVRPGDKVLACAAGKFGERWIQLCEAYGAELVRYEPGWGERLDPAEIDRLLSDDVKVAFATLSETSTGIVHDIQAIAEVAAKHGVILVVDAVSGLGAAELRQDEWGVDVVVAGSQKALMCAPGLAFASVSSRALEYASSRPGGRYYFDWGRTAKSQAKGASPFTPAVSLFLGLDVALQLIEQEGLDDVMARHRLLARATRAGVAAMGLELFGDPDERSTVVTAIELPGDDRRRQGPRRAAPARHHRQRRAGPPQGPDPADRPLRLLRRLRHPDVALGPGDGAAPARARGRARGRAPARRSGCSSRPASPPRRDRS